MGTKVTIDLKNAEEILQKSFYKLHWNHER